jgi:lipid-A-disaccharide synthase
MGFSEVVAKIPFYYRALQRLVDEAQRRKVQDAILIDFQDFNLRLAQRLSEAGIRVWYYVAPQAWAWRPWRAQTLARCTHRLFTILPFEEEWFRNRGVKNLNPVVHPLMQTWQSFLPSQPRRWEPRLRQAPRLVLLPGSRRSEVMSLLPLFVEVVSKLRTNFPQFHVSLSRVSHLPGSCYDIARPWVDQWIDSEKLPQHLQEVDTALAASGTVTLGTGLAGVPTVVAYQSSLLNEFVVRKIIGYNKAVSLTNLVLQEMVFPELLQQQAQAPLILNVLTKWWYNEQEYNQVTSRLAQLPLLMKKGETKVGELMAAEMAK